MASAGPPAASTGYATVRIKCTVPSRRHLWDVLASRQEKGAKSKPSLQPQREAYTGVEGLAAFACMHLGEYPAQQRSSHPFLKTLQARPGVIFEESGYERRTFQRGTPVSAADPRGLLGHYVVVQIEEEAMDVADAEAHIIALAVGYDQRSSKYVIWDPPESEEERLRGVPSMHLVPQNLIAKFPRRRQYFKGQDVIARWPVQQTLPPDLSAEQLIRREWTSALYPAEIVRGIDLNLIEIRYLSEEPGSSKRVHVLDVALRPKDGEPDEAELRRMKKQKRKQREREQLGIASAGVGVSEGPRPSSPSGKASAAPSSAAQAAEALRSVKACPGEAPTGTSPQPPKPVVAAARQPRPAVHSPSPKAEDSADADQKNAAAGPSVPPTAASPRAESRPRELEGARVAQRLSNTGHPASATDAKLTAQSRPKLEGAVKLEGAAGTEVPNPAAAVATKPATSSFRIPKLERSQAKAAADIEAPPSCDESKVDAGVKPEEQAHRVSCASEPPSLGSLQPRIPPGLAPRSPAPAAADGAAAALAESEPHRPEPVSSSKSSPPAVAVARSQSPPAAISRSEVEAAPAAAPSVARGANASLSIAGPSVASFRIPKQSADKAASVPAAPPAPSCALPMQRSTRDGTAALMSAPLMVLKPQAARAYSFDASSMHSPMSQPPTPSPSHPHSRTEAGLRYSVPGSQHSFGRVRRRSGSGLLTARSTDQPPSPPPEELLQDLRTWRTVLGIDPALPLRQKQYSPASTPAAAGFACQQANAKPAAVSSPGARSERLRIQFGSGRKRPRHLNCYGSSRADCSESGGLALVVEQAQESTASPVVASQLEGRTSSASSLTAAEAIAPCMPNGNSRGVSSSNNLLEEQKDVYKALLVL